MKKLLIIVCCAIFLMGFQQDHAHFNSLERVKTGNSTGYKVEIYISDAGNFNKGPYQILKLDENGQNPTVFHRQQLAWPQDILFLEDKGIVLISNLSKGYIGRYNAKTGKFINHFATGIKGPTRIKIGPDNLLYVLQWAGDGLVKRYKLDGTFVDDFTKVGVLQSIGLDWDKAGNLYVSSFGRGKKGLIRKFDTSGKDLGLLISEHPHLKGPTNIRFDTMGHLIVNDYAAGTLRKFSAQGKFIKNLATEMGKLEGIGMLKNGQFLVGSKNSVKLFDKNGLFIKDFYTSKKLLNANAVFVRYVAK